MQRAQQRAVVGTGTLGVALAAYLLMRVAAPALHPTVCSAAPDFDSFFAGRLARSRELAVRPGNEEKLLRFAPRTEFAILYVHGFSASRGEGEFVVDRVAARFQANTYYLRLPGHGTTPADQARATSQEYLREAEESLCATSALGRSVIVIGTSMGGLLATHLAARYPKRVEAVILASPFYDHASQLGRIVDALPAQTMLAGLIVGPVRETGPRPNDPRDGRLPGYERHWYTRQHTASIRSITTLRHLVSRPAVFRHVEAPVLLLYYYQTETERDNAASVPAMLEAFGEFGRAGRPDPRSRSVAIAAGSHVLMSRYVRADHARVEAEVVSFLDSVAARPNRPTNRPAP